MADQKIDLFKSTVLGHPSGLFVLFFTEMWERFSYYGMRALLVMFLTASLTDSGWGWPKENAYVLFGTYTALVYLSTMLGGYFADNVWGYRKAVVIGALLMTLGHGAMAVETPFFIYLGLTLLVFGSGFFKPNMTSIISEMYKDTPKKKDGAYTIFYMGVNAGAFFGMMLCGYLAEKIGWSYGFGLAGVFMLLGTLQFWLSKPLFGNIGEVPSKIEVKKSSEVEGGQNSSKESTAVNPFTMVDKFLIGITSVIGLVWIINDPASKIYGYNVLNFKVFGIDGSLITILLTLAIKLILYPLSAASLKSMAKMRNLQPQMVRLKELYGDDRQKMSQETMPILLKLWILLLPSYLF